MDSESGYQNKPIFPTGEMAHEVIMERTSVTDVFKKKMVMTRHLTGLLRDTPVKHMGWQCIDIKHSTQSMMWDCIEQHCGVSGTGPSRHNHNHHAGCRLVR